MPKYRRQASDTTSRRTRERLLHATVELMAEIGVDRVRTRSIAERAGVNPALVHYHFGSVSALVMEAAQDALLRTLGPAIEAFQSGASVGGSIRAILRWVDRHGAEAPGSTILAEAMVKATRNASFRRWATRASQRFRLVILDRLRAARDQGELHPGLDLPAAAILLAAALDGLLFHRLVDPTLDVMQVAGPLEAMLIGPGRRARRGPGGRKKGHQ
jgi:TetR/AcrR family transcriptional regulator, regulator of biofilm formation and stress response